MGSAGERELVSHLKAQGLFAMRAPASLGVADVVTINPTGGSAIYGFDGRLMLTRYQSISWLIEEKSTKGLVFYPSSNSNEGRRQWTLLWEMREKGHNCAFVVRYKDPSLRGKPKWRIFIVDGPECRPMKYDEGLDLEGVLY